MGIAIGIDLGTTNSCVAVVQAGRARVIEDRIGRRIHPSVVSFDDSGTPLAGHDAKDRQLTHPDRTIYCAKRLIGQDLGSVEMRQFVAELPYTVAEGPDGIPVVKVDGREVSLPEISALLLRHLRQMCNEMVGMEIADAVITVPANFNDVQRSMTKVAGRIGGFNVLRILNEPTAAALAYGFGGKRAEKIAVYDFGGGTFDITIVELADDIYEVLSTAGDTYLGGADFDKVIVEEMMRQFKKQHKVDLSKDVSAMQRIWSVAEKVKCQLSTIDEVQATLQNIGEDKKGRSFDFHFALSRKRYEEIVGHLVSRSLEVCNEALKLAGLDRSSLDNLVMVGGTTRVPLVRRRVADHFGIVPRTEINPDEVVAIGAAIQAFSLTGEQLPKELPKPPPKVPVKRPSIPVSRKPSLPTAAPRGAGAASGKASGKTVKRTIHMVGQSAGTAAAPPKRQGAAGGDSAVKRAPTRKLGLESKSDVKPPPSRGAGTELGIAPKSVPKPDVKPPPKGAGTELGIAPKSAPKPDVKPLPRGNDDTELGIAPKSAPKPDVKPPPRSNDGTELGIAPKSKPPGKGRTADADLGIDVKRSVREQDLEVAVKKPGATPPPIRQTARTSAENEGESLGLDVKRESSQTLGLALKTDTPAPTTTDTELDLDIKRPSNPDLELDIKRPSDPDLGLDVKRPLDVDLELDVKHPGSAGFTLEASEPPPIEETGGFGDLNLDIPPLGEGEVSSDPEMAVDPEPEPEAHRPGSEDEVSGSLPAVLAGTFEDMAVSNIDMPPSSRTELDGSPEIATLPTAPPPEATAPAATLEFEAVADDDDAEVEVIADDDAAEIEAIADDDAAEIEAIADDDDVEIEAIAESDEVKDESIEDVANAAEETDISFDSVDPAFGTAAAEDTGDGFGDIDVSLPPIEDGMSSDNDGFGDVPLEIPGDDDPLQATNEADFGDIDVELPADDDPLTSDVASEEPTVAPIQDEVVAAPGANINEENADDPSEQAASVAVPDNADSRSALLLDVTPRALGVAVAGGFCDIIIERNASIPVEQSRLFTTSHDDQTEVAVDVYQGEGRRIEDNTKLGQVFLTNVRPAPRGEIKIRVTFEIDTDGILGVSAHNEESEEAQRTKIVLSGGMDDDKVEELVQKYAE